MGSTTVSHSGNWLSEENWGLRPSEMSCSIINLLLCNYLQRGGHQQQRNCRREATIGILCMRAQGGGGRRGRRSAMSPRWSGAMETLLLLLAHRQGPHLTHLTRGYQWIRSKHRKSFYAFPVWLGCGFWCFAWERFCEKPTWLNLCFGSDQQISMKRSFSALACSDCELC